MKNLLSETDKKYIRQQLINIAQAREKICKRIREKYLDCNNCPLNYNDYCGATNLPAFDMETMKPEE